RCCVWCDQRMSCGADGSAGVPGNAVYLHDHPWTWFNRCRRLWYSVADSNTAGRMVQKCLQDTDGWNEYPDRIFVDCSAGNHNVICAESHKSMSLYTGNRKQQGSDQTFRSKR